MRISDIVKSWVERSPDHPALVEAAGFWSYAQLNRAIEESQAWLLNLGVRPGDRVMIVGENCRAFVAILLALAGIDAWPVLVNARLSAREIDEIQDHCGARRVVYTTSVSTHAGKHAQRHGAAIENIPNLGLTGVGPLNEITEPEPLNPNWGDRVAALIYTSGSTGHPKGVMLTHRNLLFAASGSAKIRSLGPGDRVYGVLPLSHVAGLSVAFIGALMSGATLCLFRHFDPTEAFNALRNDYLTVILGTPAMFALLVEYAGLKGIGGAEFPRLRIISSAGAPLHADLKSAAERLFGRPLQNAYGMTECSPNIAQTRIESPVSDTSVGPVFPGVEIKLIGSDRKPVADGDVGELWVRGPNIMKGYYRAPEETAAAVDAEGWFNTRDLARLENGNLYIAGRSKELIIRFGFNVYPAEVEAVLNTHPAVARSAVIGRPAAGGQGDEEVIAFVQPQPRISLLAADLADHAARHLAPYKRPSRISIIPVIPLTPNGKIAKDELAKLGAG
ncbi:MAG: class I adenylate-forming enzyme family protein [Terriglobia bacterium]